MVKDDINILANTSYNKAHDFCYLSMMDVVGAISYAIVITC